MHNLGTVIKFEILKQIRKPLFWVAVFAFPVMMFIFGGVAFLNVQLSSESAKKAEEVVSQKSTKIIVVDNSGLVKHDTFVGVETSFYSDNEQALNDFKAGSSIEGLIIYPAKISQAAIQIYTKENSNDKNQAQQLSLGLHKIATTALTNSVSSQLDPEIAAILTKSELPVETLRVGADGNVFSPYQNMIVPGIFLAVFFLVFMLTGNQILVATTEEKENRVAEMILTTVQAQTLIVGKIIALVILGFIQIASLILPLIIFYLVATKYLSLPPFLSAIISNLSFEFWPIFFGATLLIFGYLMLTGVTVLAGALFPTAQDASQFYAPIILGMMLPFYLMNAILTGGGGILISALSFFPITAPLTLLIRNMAGNLSVSEGLIGLATVVVFAILAMKLAVRAFRQGAFEYSKKGSFKELARNSIKKHS